MTLGRVFKWFLMIFGHVFFLTIFDHFSLFPSHFGGLGWAWGAIKMVQNGSEYTQKMFFWCFWTHLYAYKVFLRGFCERKNFFIFFHFSDPWKRISVKMRSDPCPGGEGGFFGGQNQKSLILTAQGGPFNQFCDTGSKPFCRPMFWPRIWPVLGVRPGGGPWQGVAWSAILCWQAGHACQKSGRSRSKCYSTRYLIHNSDRDKFTSWLFGVIAGETGVWVSSKTFFDLFLALVCLAAAEFFF